MTSKGSFRNNMKIVSLPKGFCIKLKHRWRVIDWFIPIKVHIPAFKCVWVSPKIPLTVISMPILMRQFTYISEQQRAGSTLIWYLKYFTNPSFRLEQEAMAYGRQIEYTLLLTNRQQLLQKAAKLLTSKKYLWCAKTEEEATTVINKYCNFTWFI